MVSKLKHVCGIVKGGVRVPISEPWSTEECAGVFILVKLDCTYCSTY